MKTIIIAEAGVNHNGSLEIACKLADEAKKSGADIVKYQTFIPEKLVSKYADKAEYQKKNTKNNSNQLEMLKKISLSFDDFYSLKKYCDSIGISFLSTAFDIGSVEFLHKLGVNQWKIPSGEVTDYPYLVKIANYHQPIMLSTGMCEINEIENTINVLKGNGAVDISLLHCTTEYPAPFNEVNLKAIVNLKNRFGYNVGYSDHTKGIEVAIGAVTIGATIIEKHFTLDRNMEGPDHLASLEPKELKQMVDSIRNIEAAIGNGIKELTESEKKNLIVARKSIVASKDIKKGEQLNESNITTKRPGNGVSPMRWFEVLGKEAKKDFKEDELIEI